MSETKHRLSGLPGNTYLFGGNAPYVEEMYENYLANPGSVPDSWREYFDALQHVPAVDGSNARDVPHQPGHQCLCRARQAGGTKVVLASADAEMGRKRTAVQQLIAAYRNVGPLGRSRSAQAHRARQDSRAGAVVLRFQRCRPGNGVRHQQHLLRQRPHERCASCSTRCARRTAAPSARSTCSFDRPESEALVAAETGEHPQQAQLQCRKEKHILDRLTAAEGLERFLHTKYVGQKRFSLEGGESFIAAMDELIQQAGAKGVQEIVIGMAHRGRLNVLVNTLGKMPADLFAEFDHTAPEDLPAGDVKYHQGFSSDVSTPGGPVHLSLAFNPSHLEIVNPVVEGSVRARMDRRGDPRGSQVLPVLVHGDAAFAGQGVNQETLALAQTRGYTTGGTVHLIINNQIGFTTSDPRDLRSTLYCTDIVKGVESPVLHVNGDDPEAVVLAAQLALEYRMEFRKDVVVDIICFRKLGHNEQDTPSLTQPLMYKKIAQHPGTRKLYADRWPPKVWARRWVTTWPRHTVPPWTPASTRSIRC
jgi:2-oxoglutarate dehydrogenase E1 component